MVLLVARCLAPPGRHRLSIRYFPDAVARGVAVSGATLLLCAFLLFRPAGRELRQNPV